MVTTELSIPDSIFACISSNVICIPLGQHYSLYTSYKGLNAPLRAKKKTIDISAPAGNVTIHDKNIFLITLVSSAAIPRAKPTPSTAPTSTCVVDTGKPVPDAITTVEAAAKVAANPLDGVNWVIPVPTVAITLWP
jgi:hypothetical protein